MAVSGLLAALVLAACSDPVTASDSAVAKDEPGAAGPAPVCTDGSFLRGRLVGVVEAAVDWAAGDIRCEGGPRPDGEGVRLRFARDDADGAGLAVIVAIPALSRRATGAELATNVTLIIEGEARFFSTQNRETCWADVRDNELIGGDRYAIEGELYCIAPLAEVNGDDSVMLDGFKFRGVVDWARR